MDVAQAMGQHAPGYRFDGSTVLVTGAGSGTGRSMAIEFARAGARVVLVARTRAALEDTAREVREACGPAAGDDRALVAPCDVTDRAAVRALIAGLPALDVLVNNAGTNIPEPFGEVTEQHLDTLIGLNLRAAFVVAQAAVARMGALGRGGVVLNVTSQMGQVGAPERTAYCMTKHGLEGLTRAMAVELAPQGLRVNSIAPTFVDTPLIRRIVDATGRREALLARIPAGRMASELEVAAAALYLASGQAASVTGACLLVDGGWTAQ
jgi:NAD(P)-dependent dehydrogenase (short-subunit alcohol dehydrogenase family)